MHPKTVNHTKWIGFATLKLAGFTTLTMLSDFSNLGKFPDFLRPFRSASMNHRASNFSSGRRTRTSLCATGLTIFQAG